ncbi:hypothetical protein [Minwuia thermotolerans]|uniref:Uncharacterized protein n=1 Tax=Minwuia thermotolerans TaxID=2056226 RepID=A0A2M9G4E7_9PROT|nr:hypothetical protein [Minwuia thermotolerans]PJK30599.1 hypothetical protein CVT23_06555 [Minwuia thermotolerans]
MKRIIAPAGMALAAALCIAAPAAAQERSRGGELIEDIVRDVAIRVLDAAEAEIRRGRGGIGGVGAARSYPPLPDDASDEIRRELRQLDAEHDRKVAKLEQELRRKVEKAEAEFRREAAKEDKAGKIEEKGRKLDEKVSDAYDKFEDKLAEENERYDEKRAEILGRG